MNISFQVCILLGAFLLGSIPFGVLVARAFKIKDLRVKGSGNIGATNVSRVVGFWPAGFLTFLFDLLKGAGPIALMAYTGLPDALGSLIHIQDGSSLTTPLLLWSMGLFAVLGHCYSPWIQFKGGKGVATAFGVLAVLSPLSALAGLIGYVCAFMLTKVSSVGSLTGLTLTAVAYLVMNPVTAATGPGALLIFVILIRHEANLDALLENRERHFG
jgi:glycerol-3-phosphate acyltransferase PlsY